MHTNNLATLALIPDEWTQCFILWKILENHGVRFPCSSTLHLLEENYVERSILDGIAYYRRRAQEEKKAMGKDYEGVPTTRFRRQSPIDVHVNCYGWDAITQDDRLLPSVTVTVFADVGNSTGRMLDYECTDPQQLWNYLRSLSEDPLATLKQHFNYEPPATSRTARTAEPLPDDLNSLFN